MPKTDLSFDVSEYALVADRVALFYARYPEGRIITELVSRTEREVTFRALVYRTLAEREPSATGWASEREGDGDVNLVACLENTETSAIGRALANLGFTASRRRPSREEMLKAERERARPHARRVSEALQARADALADVLALLEKAGRCGMRAARVRRTRERLLASKPSLAELERVRERLRTWLEKGRESAAADDWLESR
jgi:hypothetical protein